MSKESSSTSSSKKTGKTKKLDKKDMNLFETMDHIATHYILTMDFQSLKKMQEEEYCDSLLVLTSSIIDSQFTTLDITNLEKRVEQGSKPELLLFVKKENLVPNFKKKEQLCGKISRFYVKIAHLFACIVHAINPVYSYTDFWGETVKVPFLEKDTIPEGTTGISIEKLNLCNNRQTILENLVKNDSPLPLKDPADSDGDSDKDSDGDSESHNVCSIIMASTTVDEEPGIPELMELYYDDDYDLKTGTFKGMSKETRKLFETDLLRFYNTFTGKEVENLPASVKRFSDIKLRDYCRMKKCPDINTSVDTFSKEFLLTSYAKNLLKMMTTINEKHQELLGILNELFLKTGDEVSIHPGLTDESLQILVERTRTCIIELYLHCEVDFVNGIHMYEAIVHYQVLESTQNQIKQLDLKKDELISSSK